MIAEASLLVFLMGPGKTDHKALKDAVKLTPVQMAGGKSMDRPVETCVWPHVCEKDGKKVILLADQPVETCVWPHLCRSSNN